MKKVFFLSFCVLGLLPVLFSQEIKQSVIATDGGIAKGNNLSLEWTLGEFAVESFVSGKHLYTQGFHQPVLIVKSINSPPRLEIPDKKISGYNVLIAPNPAKSYFNVFLTAKESEKFSMTLSDMQGRRIAEREVAGTNLNVRFDISAYSSGIYLLNVQKSSGERLHAFKIVIAH